MEKICEHCGEVFEAKRKDVVYCSASCRQMAYMNRKLNFNSNESDLGKISFSGMTLNSENEESFVKEELINNGTEDVEQSDKFKDKTKSGLFDAKMRLQDVKGIGIFEFSNKDIVRNPIIGEILNRYD